jgi:hypothetical protein
MLYDEPYDPYSRSGRADGKPLETSRRGVFAIGHVRRSGRP